jgi:hypothetical protein
MQSPQSSELCVAPPSGVANSAFAARFLASHIHVLQSNLGPPSTFAQKPVFFVRVDLDASLISVIREAPDRVSPLDANNMAFAARGNSRPMLEKPHLKNVSTRASEAAFPSASTAP